MLRRLLTLIVIPLCVAASLIAQKADTDARFALPLQFAGTAFGQSGAAAGKNFGFTVFITDWTTAQQVKDFTDTLRENGQDGLVKTFAKTKDVGRFCLSHRRQAHRPTHETSSVDPSGA